MKLENKKKCVVIGIMLIILGIAGLGYGVYTHAIVNNDTFAADATPLQKPNPAPQMIGAILTAIGIGLLTAGTRKDDAFDTTKKAVADKKKDKVVTTVGAEHHEGIYHGV
jgi:hypothetical protein